MSEVHVKLLLKAKEDLVVFGKFCATILPYGLTWHDPKEKLEIISQIEEDLCGKFSLEEWLAAKYGKQVEFFYAQDLTPTSLAWIDALIEYWRDK